jgi:hypothetical protein
MGMSSETSEKSGKIKPWPIYACGAFLCLVLIANGWWITAILDRYHWKIEWEAWATFGAGALAVGAALSVGRKQADIQAEQVAIQKRQIEVERELREREIRAQLWLARKEIIDEAQKIFCLPKHAFHEYRKFADEAWPSYHKARYLFLMIYAIDTKKLSSALHLLLQALLGHLITDLRLCRNFTPMKPKALKIYQIQ